MSTRTRLEHIGDAALHLLAERGARGLTHRAVDERAELPPGSTSYYARSRSALLQLALTQATAADQAIVATSAHDFPPDDRTTFANQVGDLLHRMITASRTQTVARYELALEATRRPELRESYATLGVQFQELVTVALTHLGSPAPARHGRALLAWCEGVLFRSTAGTEVTSVPSKRELRTTARELISALL